MTSLRTVNGFYVCAEGGGGSVVMADRPHAGPWEQWVATMRDDGTVTLQASTGAYLCAELDGTVKADRLEAGPWESFLIEVRDGAVCFKTAHGTYLQAPMGGGPGSKLCHLINPQMPGEWEFFDASEPFWHVEPDVPQVARPLVGPLRIQDKVFVDDTGYRRVLFCSWFPALRILRDNPTEFYRQLDSIVTAGYQGVRVFLAVGGWTDYWDGREVAPIRFQKWFFTGNHMRTDQLGHWIEAWPDYDDLLRELLQACKARKLRLHVTNGDMQIIAPDPNVEIDLHRRYARICAEEGGREVIALAETTNEFSLNRYGAESPESIAQMGRLLEVWNEALPNVCTAQGAIPGNEEPDALYLMSTHGNVCAVHVSRDPWLVCIKHTHALVYWEGDYRHFPKPYWEGEPCGPGEDSYARIDDPAFLTAVYSMMALTGQATNWFQGAGVRSYVPLDSEWGFAEMPPLLMLIPEDIVTWEHASNQHGGIEYWFKGHDFMTATYIDWDTSPPRPVATWTIYDGVNVSTGTGTPPRCTGLIVGTFA